MKLLRAFDVAVLLGVMVLVGCGTLGIQNASYVYKSVGGCDLRADIYYQARDVPQPAILWLHPGALITGNRVWIDDLVDAYTWLGGEGPALFNADPERIGVVGHSAGGYLALMTGFCVTPRPQRRRRSR